MIFFWEFDCEVFYSSNQQNDSQWSTKLGNKIVDLLEILKEIKCTTKLKSLGAL